MSLYLNADLYIYRSKRLPLDEFPEVGKILKATRQKLRSFVSCFHAFLLLGLRFFGLCK